MSRYTPSQGGHAPGHLRELLCIGIGDGGDDWPNGLATSDANVWWNENRAAWWNGLTVEQRARWITGQLWNCTDVLPSSAYQELEMEGHPHTYGAAARLLRARI